MRHGAGPPGGAIRGQGGDLEGIGVRRTGSAYHHRHPRRRAWPVDRAPDGRGRHPGRPARRGVNRCQRQPRPRPGGRGRRDKGNVMADGYDTEIRTVLRDHARLRVDVETLGTDADLFAAGMSSHASVNVMLALEDTFDIEFPDAMLKRSVFESVAAIDAAVR